MKLPNLLAAAVVVLVVAVVAFLLRAPQQAVTIAVPAGPNAAPALDSSGGANPDPALPPLFGGPPQQAATPLPGDPTPTALALYAEQLQTSEGPVFIPAGQATPDGWNPPTFEVPLARHPFDHYWFVRPVAADNRNYGLEYYPYGSNGPANDLRIHHGVDFSNPVGVEVYATAAGIVVEAGEGHFNEYDSITAYGNTISIKHDFGYNGQEVYTLYAHLSAILVQEGQRVEPGDVIGLIGSTGLVSGPHVHYEVRVGRNSYFAVRNPELWIAPYLGTGTIAGRVAFANDDPVYDVEVELTNLATRRITHRSGTYSGQSVNGDDNWNENFVFADVPEGNYTARAQYGETVWIGQVTVLPGVTNWIDMLLNESAFPGTTPTPQVIQTPDGN